MADQHGAARTNYFQVKDAAAFQAWAQGLSLIALQPEGTDLWALYSPEGQAWPRAVADEGAHDGSRVFDIVVELAPHVVAGCIVVWMETRHTEARVLTGEAGAFQVTEAGCRRIGVWMNDIYWLAETVWGAAPTRCSG